MLRLIRPFQRRGWATVRMLVLSVYLIRGGEMLNNGIAHRFGLSPLPKFSEWSWYVTTPSALVLFVLSDAILTGLKSVRLGSLLRRRDLPAFLHPLENFWSREVCEQVWRPAYYDAEARYHEQPPGSSRKLCNLFFLRDVVWMFLQTLNIAVMVRPLSRLWHRFSR